MLLIRFTPDTLTKIRFNKLLNVTNKFSNLHTTFGFNDVHFHFKN